jgi:hypothetical protein
LEDNQRYPEKGRMPSHDPFNPEKRKNRITLRERKFLYLLSQTGSLQVAFRSVYKVKHNDDKRIESAHVGAMANQVLTRLRRKSPELVSAFTFGDITVDFVKKGILDLYYRAKDSNNMHIEKGVLELMGKINAMFTEKHVSDIRILDTIKSVYKETDADMPDEHRDDRVSRSEIENNTS